MIPNRWIDKLARIEMGLILLVILALIWNRASASPISWFAFKVLIGLIPSVAIICLSLVGICAIPADVGFLRRWLGSAFFVAVAGLVVGAMYWMLFFGRNGSG